MHQIWEDAEIYICLTDAEYAALREHVHHEDRKAELRKLMKAGLSQAALIQAQVRA